MNISAEILVYPGMEHKKSWMKLTVAAMASALLLSNCVTSYDSYGRPIQTADPAAVAAGAVILGVAAYAVGKNNRSHHKHYRRGHGHHGHHGYRSHGYYGRHGYSSCGY